MTAVAAQAEIYRDWREVFFPIALQRKRAPPRSEMLRARFVVFSCLYLFMYLEAEFAFVFNSLQTEISPESRGFLPQVTVCPPRSHGNVSLRSRYFLPRVTVVDQIGRFWLRGIYGRGILPSYGGGTT